MSQKSFSIINLGCFRNAYDSKILVQEFIDKGYRHLPGARHVDTLIVNTCGFIDKAKEESLGVIKEALSLKTTHAVKKVIIAGCLSQRYVKDLKKHFPHVDEWRGVLKVEDKAVKYSAVSASEFLKVCEGCINRCSYCAIPVIKGTLQSRSQESILEEAKFLEQRGVKELNIIGQDTSSWGMDTKCGDLSTLVDKIIKTTSIAWIRLLYLHPKHINQELLDLIANEPRICKYIDLPIQHIHDRILKLMNRRISRYEIQSLIDSIRSQIPNAVLRTSVIVGFPTETEKEFQALCDFIKNTRFDRLGAFSYSREEDTPAYAYSPQVHPQTKKRRLHELMMLQKEIAGKLNGRFVGQTLDVLIEGKEDGVFIARSQFDAGEVDGVVFVKRKGLKIGEFYTTKIVDNYEYDLVGI